MLRFLSGFVLIFSALTLLYAKSPLKFYMKPKQERLYQLWNKDFQELTKDKKFAKVFSQLGKVEIHFTDPQVANEFEEFKTPFHTKASHPYFLKVSITRWIEHNRYGFIVQHELFDSSEDKIYEFGRTYTVGLIF